MHLPGNGSCTYCGWNAGRGRHAILRNLSEVDMNNTKLKLLAIGLLAAAVMAILVFRTTPAAAAAGSADDAAKTYKTKCMACHGPAAAKFYDPAKPDAEQVDAIMHGKKGAKPPFMPPFGDKGITEDAAKELVAYMKTLKK